MLCCMKTAVSWHPRVIIVCSSLNDDVKHIIQSSLLERNQSQLCGKIESSSMKKRRQVNNSYSNNNAHGELDVINIMTRIEVICFSQSKRKTYCNTSKREKKKPKTIKTPAAKIKAKLSNKSRVQKKQNLCEETPCKRSARTVCVLPHLCARQMLAVI